MIACCFPNPPIVEALRILKALAAVAAVLMMFREFAGSGGMDSVGILPSKGLAGISR